MLSLSAILNSSVISFWLRYAGSMQGANYQIDAAPLLEIPIVKPSSEDHILSHLTALTILAKSYKRTIGYTSTLENLNDACVLEYYFYNHMKERDLLFHEDVDVLVRGFNSQDTMKQQLNFLEGFYTTVNSPDHPIRNRLLRLTADSPDMLAVIKESGMP